MKETNKQNEIDQDDKIKPLGKTEGQEQEALKENKQRLMRLLNLVKNCERSRNLSK